MIPNSFSLQWEMVPCIHRNGDITGYSVQYRVGSESTQTVSISTMNTTITGLTSDTSYEVEVAGVNSIGIGEYDFLTVDTPQSQYIYLIHVHMSNYSIVCGTYSQSQQYMNTVLHGTLV